VGILKALFKLALLALVGTAIAGVVAVVRRPATKSAISFDQWPAVPTKPNASTQP
jgi:hypothetical protein